MVRSVDGWPDDLCTLLWKQVLVKALYPGSAEAARGHVKELHQEIARVLQEAGLPVTIE